MTHIKQRIWALIVGQPVDGCGRPARSVRDSFFDSPLLEAQSSFYGPGRRGRSRDHAERVGVREERGTVFGQ